MPSPTITRRPRRAAPFGAALLTALALLPAIAMAAAGQAPAGLRTARPDLARSAAATQPLSPGQIHSAYALPLTGARGQRIAVVSAYSDPYVPADLAAYSRRYGIPACTVAGGCLRVLNQRGQPGPLPGGDPSGGSFNTESALGVELARGVCQSCSIMLVEADSSGKADLAGAANAAAEAGATVVTTTFTPAEDPFDEELYGKDFTHPRTTVVAAAGEADQGYGYSGAVDFPSALAEVIAVGGTTLRLGAHGAYAGEGAWISTMSGCSNFQPAPAWQALDAAAAGCQTRRTVADISAVADPGVEVRVSAAGIPGGPWYTATGTSVAAPIIAGVVGLAGSVGAGEARQLYDRARSDPAAFHDVRSGVTAPYCGGLICRAGPGYDGPTGLGTPFGLAAFLPSGGALSTRHPPLTVSVPRRRLAVDRRWRARVTLTNANPFAVAGSLALTRTLRLGGRLQTVTFAAGRISLAPLGSATESLTVRRGERALLRRLGGLVAYVGLRVHGPVGPTAATSYRLALSAP